MQVVGIMQHNQRSGIKMSNYVIYCHCVYEFVHHFALHILYLLLCIYVSFLLAFAAVFVFCMRLHLQCIYICIVFVLALYYCLHFVYLLYLVCVFFVLFLHCACIVFILVAMEDRLVHRLGEKPPSPIEANGQH